MADEIIAQGGRAIAVALDLTAPESIAAAMGVAEDIGGGLGTVVYAPGSKPAFDHLSRLDIAEWRRVLELDLFGLIALITAALPALRRSRGSIVAVSTYQQQRLEAQGALSAVPKAAAERLIAVVAREEARYGVRANCIRSGWISGGHGARMIEAERTEQRILDKIPLGRLGLPQEIGEAVAYLACTAAGFTTGAVLTVDGGQSL